MASFWITAGNTKFDRKRMRLKKLSYPLAYYSPATAFGWNTPIVLPSEYSQLGLGVELAVSIKTKLANADKEKAEQAIDEYFCCTGLSNYWHLSRIHKPTPRDKGVCEYYSRWNDSANTLFKLNALSLHQTGGLVCQMESEHGEKLVVNYETDHSASEILSFLSKFTTLFPGTIICLGQAGRLKIPKLKAVQYLITIAQLNFTATAHVQLPEVD